MAKHNPDYLKNKTASVIKHGEGNAIPQGHWQVNRNVTPEGNNSGWGAFLPRKGKDRPPPHTKINECDH
jgi:hypothetical protein